MSSAPSPTPSGWFIVSQVKSNRVVYFTDDPGYRPPSEGDWYFVSHHLGELPPGMTLRNCWSWRFDGSGFSDPGDPTPQGEAASLLAANRKAVHALLRTRIDDMRAPWTPSGALGETLRAAKLAEAQAFLAGGAGTGTFALLEGVAVARAITLAEAAALVVERARSTQQALVASEALRERFACAIDAALTNEELVALRERLIGEVDPARAGTLARPANPMTPGEWDEPLPDAARGAEAARLRTQLREAVNARRRRVHDGYVADETLVKHKAQLAQALLNNDGVPPAGMDFSLLANYAQAHSLKLEDAARLVMGTVTEAEAILRATERDKDRLLARIEAARTLRDFQRLGQDIAALERNA
jgi:hypothetical protein